MGEIIEIADGRRGHPGDTVDAAGIEGARRVLDQYLGEDEEPQYLLTNGQRGLILDDDGDCEEIEPSAGHNTVVILTDVRTLFVVGGADGTDDRVVNVPYVEIVAVRREESFFSERLVLVTPAQRWEVPFKGDLERVEAYLERALSAWSGARTAIESFRERMSDALDRLDASEYDAALDRADAAEAALMQAQSRLESLGPGAMQSLTRLAGEDDVAMLRTRVHLDRGERHHERAQDAIEAGAYHDAHDAMTTARDALQRAADLQPPSLDEPVEDRLATVKRDLADLSRRPLADARSAYEHALELDGMGRAIALEEALEEYRDALSVCWGDRGDQFDGDPEAIRERIIEIVEGIYEAWTNLAWDRLVDGDAYADQGDDDRARTHYDDARTHLDRARAVTRELHPDLDSDLDPWFEAVDDRLESLDAPSTASPDGVPEPSAEVQPLSAGGFDHQLDALDSADLTDLLADVVTRNGWSTTTVAGDDDPYDLIASRDDPFDIRILVCVVGDDGTPTTRDVTRLADAADATSGADVGVLVAPEIPPPVHDRATERGLTVLSAERLATIIEADRTPESGAAA
ncbi:restriction endonuclease [Halococcoides cellulosivorans]|uniref:Restriction endonuclease type IV Mrr domain-containing protein n=1 Tax=Halococcoides cellulosivorans TaxID=1679096 RepID=A0A2R4X343_9EURY|nr:restriction endonuclease [Halococcoides cellulosivorans]AWB28221.1 hypothetical protein HARCEL1_11160 [Halococcoides cellulosivorans]